MPYWYDYGHYGCYDYTDYEGGTDYSQEGGDYYLNFHPGYMDNYYNYYFYDYGLDYGVKPPVNIEASQFTDKELSKLRFGALMICIQAVEVQIFFLFFNHLTRSIENFR